MKVTLHPAVSFRQLGGRGNQEDSRYPDTDRPRAGQRCFVVCDGVGGSERGEVASGIVAKTLGEFLDRAVPDAKASFTNAQLQQAFDEAWNALNRQHARQPADMATTVTLAVFHAGGLTVAHMGDSRIYLVRPTDNVLYRSDDDTVVNAMVRSGILTPEQALHHPQRNIITRYMAPIEGDQTRCLATVNTFTDLRPGDYLLLCTDGVTDVLSDEQLLAIVCNELLSDEQKIAELAQQCAGSRDNNTALLVGIAAVDPAPADNEQPPAGTTTAPIDNPEPGATEIRTDAPRTRRSGLLGWLGDFFG